MAEKSLVDILKDFEDVYGICSKFSKSVLMESLREIPSYPFGNFDSSKISINRLDNPDQLYFTAEFIRYLANGVYRARKYLSENRVDNHYDIPGLKDDVFSEKDGLKQYLDVLSLALPKLIDRLHDHVDKTFLKMHERHALDLVHGLNEFLEGKDVYVADKKPRTEKVTHIISKESVRNLISDYNNLFTAVKINAFDRDSEDFKKYEREFTALYMMIVGSEEKGVKGLLSLVPEKFNSDNFYIPSKNILFVPYLMGELVRQVNNIPLLSRLDGYSSTSAKLETFLESVDRFSDEYYGKKQKR